jgi:hypothetical protein
VRRLALLVTVATAYNHRTTYLAHNPTSRWIDTEQAGNSYNNQQFIHLCIKFELKYK